MTGPSSAPRGERAGTPGAGWERELVRGLEHVVPEDDGNPFAWDEPGPGEYRPNRATRRAARRSGARTGTQTAHGTKNAPPGPQTGTHDHEH